IVRYIRSIALFLRKDPKVPKSFEDLLAFLCLAVNVVQNHPTTQAAKETVIMEQATRRKFLYQTTIGSGLVCSLAEAGRDLFSAQGQPTPRYDLLVKGGRVIDPSQQLSGELDIAVSGRKIVRVTAGIPETEARHVLNARGKIVTPGLI